LHSPASIQAGDYLYRSNHEYWNGSALIVGGQFAFDNTNNANRTQFTVAVTTDGTSVEASSNARNVQFKIDGNDSGAITFNNAYKFPTSDGSANQVLQTDGSGNLSFNFTATDGSTVGLTTAASAGDAVDIVVYEPQASATPKRVVTNATATAGQTAFTVPSYDTGSNSMDVFLNGIKLDSAEFTETDGTTVTLAVGAALNDELQFISYESDNNFWSLNGGTLHRSSISNPVAIGTDTRRETI
jgi:hypothetical protein